MKLLIILALVCAMGCYPERETPEIEPGSPPSSPSEPQEDAGSATNGAENTEIDAGPSSPLQWDAGQEDVVPGAADAGDATADLIMADAGDWVAGEDAGMVGPTSQNDSGPTDALVPDAGPHCADGFEWDGVSSSCLDVNECETANGGCEHTCSNTAGGFGCSCNDGYTLNGDDSTCDSPQERAMAIAQSFGVGDMAIAVEVEDVIEQNAMGNVQFEEAFYQALDSFLTDGSDDESPIQWVIAFDGDAGALKEYMNEAGMWLVPNRARLSPDAWYPPEYGESIDNYWVFFMTSDAELNALFWALVPRDGSATYNYGFD